MSVRPVMIVPLTDEEMREAIGAITAEAVRRSNIRVSTIAGTGEVEAACSLGTFAELLMISAALVACAAGIPNQMVVDRVREVMEGNDQARVIDDLEGVVNGVAQEVVAAGKATTTTQALA